ncbi:MAG: hypothetical protein ACRC8S_15785 [Fimbriiglobus sp.]
MKTLLMLVFGLFSLSLAAVAVEDKKEDKKEEKQPIKGQWIKDTDGIEISFHFKTKDQLLIKASAGGNSMTATCKYKVEKDKVSAEVTEVKEEGDFPSKPPKGYKMSFKFKVEKDTAKLEDYEAENKEEVKPIIEGEYKSKKAD